MLSTTAQKVGVGHETAAAGGGPDPPAADPDAGRFFVSPVVDRAEKAKVVAGVFEGRVSDIALHTLLLLVHKRREALLAPIVVEYDKLALADAGRERLDIQSAQEMQPAEADALVARLEKIYNKTFSVTRRVNPALLGGLRITMGDRRIDGSVAGRLDDLARDLMTSKCPLHR